MGGLHLLWLAAGLRMGAADAGSASAIVRPCVTLTRRVSTVALTQRARPTVALTIRGCDD